MIKLDAKLTDEEKAYLFRNLFSMRYEDISEGNEETCYVLFDSEGEEIEDGFTFFTLEDFFDYAEHLAFLRGRYSLKTDLRNLLKY